MRQDRTDFILENASKRGPGYTKKYIGVYKGKFGILSRKMNIKAHESSPI
jgi:hypothetical protein